MAIAGTPQNVNVTQANGQVLIQWSLQAGATSYNVQRSSDYGVTYSIIANVTAPQYVDTTAALQTEYYYQVASVNTSGTSAYSQGQSIIPTPTGEMSLAELRTAALQRADRLNSQFVTLPELNQYIQQSYFELYDLLITAFEDYFMAPPLLFTTQGNVSQYPLPDGTLYNGAPAFYKILGLDLGINNANNAYVTVQKYNFIDRNKYIYPNTASTIYGVFNLQYRVMGNQLQLIPVPSNNQPLRLWYIPRLKELLLDTDTTSNMISGWTEYIITDVAIKILQKEESDVSVLVNQKAALMKRIEDAAANRDAGQPDTISDVRGTGWGGSGPFNGFRGGW